MILREESNQNHIKRVESTLFVGYFLSVVVVVLVTFKNLIDKELISVFFVSFVWVCISIATIGGLIWSYFSLT